MRSDEKTSMGSQDRTTGPERSVVVAYATVKPSAEIIRKELTMETVYVGLDVHNETVVVAACGESGLTQ